MNEAVTERFIENAKEKYKDGIYCQVGRNKIHCRTREEFIDCIHKMDVGIDLQTMLVIAGLPSEEDNNVK